MVGEIYLTWGWQVCMSLKICHTEMQLPTSLSQFIEVKLMGV